MTGGSMKVYVLIGEYGEYGNLTTVALGTFSSEEAAREAIPRIEALSDQQFKLWEEHRATRLEYLKRFEPEYVGDTKFGYPPGWNIYRSEHHAEVAAAVGPEPDLVPHCDKYTIECFTLDGDAIEARQVMGQGTEPITVVMRASQ